MDRADLLSATSSVVAMTVQIDPLVERETENEREHREQNHARPDFHSCVRRAQAGNVHEEFAHSATGIALCASFSRA